ncbi:MAG: ABC transporter permease, partial [Defluviitaleaceae bacterium]|nr:ABC transporter permease [Defluviitaleaceae bacterium]
MSNLDILSMSLRSLIKRKLRTFLTILGVVIGTMAIVLMVSLGLAINQKYADQIASLGDVTTVTVYNNYSYGYSSMAMSAAGGQQAPQQVILDDAAIAKFAALPGVVAATPFLQYYLSIKSGNYVLRWCTLIGIYPDAMAALGYTAAQGRLLEPGDKFNVVFGAK